MDGYDVRKLLQLLKRECGLTDSQIDDVKVLDSFSFVTVPFSEAKEAIRRLNDISNGGRPIAEIAQDGQGRGARGAYKKEGFKKDYKGKRDSAGYAKGSSYGAGSRKDSGEGWKAGATRGAKPGARGARDAQAVGTRSARFQKEKGRGLAERFYRIFCPAGTRRLGRQERLRQKSRSPQG